MKIALLGTVALLTGCSAAIQIGNPNKGDTFTKQEVAAAFQQRDEMLNRIIKQLESKPAVAEKKQ